MEKKIALLIDAENISAKYLDNIFMELKSFGTITYKRMYGDFTSDRLHEWNRKSLDYAVVPIQQPRYSNAKNAADIMLVIDAMDILYGKNVDIFCIVSSDSDFTRLVNRLCDGGMEVIGMGNSNASRTLKAACTIYKNLEMIFADENTEEMPEEAEGVDTTEEAKSKMKDTITSIEKIKKSIMDIVLENSNQDNRTGLGGLKSSLQRIYTDFDERNYGYSSMKKFVGDLNGFDVIQEGTSIYITISEEKDDQQLIEDYIVTCVKKTSMDLAVLGKKIHEKFPDFNVRNYGYSQLSKFIENMNDIVIESKKNAKIAKYKTKSTGRKKTNV